MVRLLFLSVLLVGCQARHDAPAAGSASASQAVGAHAPSVQLTALSGERVALDSVIGAHDKTIVVFYRGFY
jgi:hypothetical protein